MTDASTRRFPSPSWAWPQGALDQLLVAATGHDAAHSEQQFRAWLAEHDLDEASFREHRLLAAIAARFGKALADRPEYPRLVGLQRQLWTRSRMALAEATPLLQQLVQAGVPVMLLKGGARIAARPEDQIARVAHDLDILVPPSHFRVAMEALFHAGWTASSGESRLCLLAREKTIRAMNFFHGRFGDIDLHQWGYGDALPVEAMERPLWQHAEAASLLGVSVRVPSATDRLALAICHSGLDAHTHSDWLVDCAQIIREDPIDWDRLLHILTAMQAPVQAQVALSYLAWHIGVPVPAQALSQLMANQHTPWWQRAANLLQAKPRTDWGWASRLARGLAKQGRLLMVRRREDQAAVQRPGVLRASVLPARTVAGVPAPASALRHPLPWPAQPRVHLDLTVQLELTGVHRRFEFELNTDQQHLLRLRARNLWGRHGPMAFRFKGTLAIPPGAQALWLEARPGKQLRGGEPASDVNRYAAAGFQVTSCTFEPVR